MLTPPRIYVGHSSPARAYLEVQGRHFLFSAFRFSFYSRFRGRAPFLSRAFAFPCDAAVPTVPTTGGKDLLAEYAKGRERLPSSSFFSFLRFFNIFRTRPPLRP